MSLVIENRPARIITARKAIELLRDARDVRGGDFTYKQPKDSSICRYYHEEADEVGCIVGLALSLVGVTDESLKVLDHSSRIGSGGVRAGDMGGAFVDGVEISHDAAKVFAAAQHVQDGGNTWDNAVYSAECRFGEIQTIRSAFKVSV